MKNYFRCIPEFWQGENLRSGTLSRETIAGGVPVSRLGRGQPRTAGSERTDTRTERRQTVRCGRGWRGEFLRSLSPFPLGGRMCGPQLPRSGIAPQLRIVNASHTRRLTIGQARSRTV